MQESTEFFNADDVKATLKFLSRDEGIMELRILGFGEQKHTGVGFFTDHGSLIESAAKWNGRAKGLYLTLNPVNPNLLKMSSNRVRFGIQSAKGIDILSRQFLPLDFDPVRPKGTSSTDEELQKALTLAEKVMKELSAQGFPTPVMANSGNGAHLLYPINLPNDDKSDQLIKRVLRAISKSYSTEDVNIDTAIGNASRIFKLYGTLAAKGIATEERPHRLSRLVSVPDQSEIVSEEQLEKLVNSLETDHAACRTTKAEITGLPTLDPILKGCPWLRNCKENAAEVNEPEWYAMLSIVGHCENGETLAHELSSPHPTYSKKKTDEKLRHALESAAPRTCENIELISGGAFCENCELKGKIKSPIVIGRNGMDSAKYFTEKGRFVPAALGKDIVDNFPLFHDGQHLFVYENGVYNRNGRERVQQLSQKVLASASRKNYVEETLYWVKNEVFKAPGSLNQNDGLINVNNGLLDWRTGELLPHTPERLSTVQIPVAYKPTAKCPDIERFVSEVVAEGVVPLIYEIAGYLLCPTTKFERAFMFTGHGANGKSTLLKVLTALVGSENTTNIPLQDLEHNRFKAALLHGKLLNTFADLPANVLEKSSIFKAVVSGDRINAEFKGQDSFDYTPFCRLLFSANELPTSKDVSMAFFRRWIIVHFPNSFEGKKDSELINRLLTPENLSGFLNLAIEGLRRLESNKGFTIDETTRLNLEQYQRDADSVVSFVEECCDLIPAKVVEKSELYRAYTSWCKENGLWPLGRPRFNKRLKEHCTSVVETRKKNSEGRPRLWTGIRLNSTFLY